MNILLTSIGRRSYLASYFKQALNGSGLVIGANSIPGTSGLLACDFAETVPFAFHEDYIPRLLDICRHHEIKLLFSLHDLDAPFIADAYNSFIEIGTTAVMAGREFIDIALDKFSTVQFAQKNGLFAPLTWLSAEEALSAVKSGQVEFPLIIKPRWGFGSIGLQVVHDADELQWGWSLAKSVVQRSWISRAPGYSASKPLIIQQMINGQEYGVDIINDLSSNYVTSFVKHKFAMRSGETDAAEIVDKPLLMEVGERIGRMGLHPGLLDVDLIVEDDKAYVIELNPRFGGHYPFAHLAGANIPAALIAWANGQEPDPAWLRAEVGVRGYKDLVPKRIRA